MRTARLWPDRSHPSVLAALAFLALCPSPVAEAQSGWTFTMIADTMVDPTRAVCILEVFGPTASGAEPARLGETSRKVLDWYKSQLNQTPDAFPEGSLKPPPDEKWRNRVLASLPRNGELPPSPVDLTKIAAAERLLDYTARRRLDFKVIEVDQAFVGLYLRTVVLVSARALAILEAEEFAALVAHELGHDADADAYQQAIDRRDNRRMRELELRADGSAVLTLERAGLDTERLVTAVQKMVRYNDWRAREVAPTARASVTLTDDRYVPLEERIAFIRAAAALRWARAPTSSRALAVARPPEP